MRHIAISLVFMSGTAWASSNSIGPNGINSESTELDGTGIEIGQVEPTGRSAKAGFDDASVSASNTIPTQVYFGTAVDSANGHISAHATGVAGVMIGKPEVGFTLYEGVAPNANLHSGAFGGGDDVDAALTLNRIATLSACRHPHASDEYELRPRATGYH